MTSWTYTDQKKDLEFCFENGDFAPSTKYKIQSPFNATKSYPSKSTWDLWFVELSNYSFTFTGQDTMLVYYNVEAVLMSIEDFGIAPAAITLLSDNDNKTALAQAWGVEVITDCKEIPKMKFTHVIKNPPWDDGVYSKFWPLAHDALVPNGYQVDILPTNWMSLPSFSKNRKYLLENFQILSLRVYDNSKRLVFDANPGGAEVVVIVSRKCLNPDNRLVEYTYFDSPTFTIDLTKYDIWPLYQSSIAPKILDLIVGKKVCDLNVVGYRKAEHNFNDRVTKPYFIACQTLVHQRVKSDLSSTPSTTWKLNQLHNIVDETIIQFDDQIQCALHAEWFASPMWSYILSMVKSQGKNQPGQFIFTGQHNFTDNDFVSYFGFTKQHLDEVTQWKSKV